MRFRPLEEHSTPSQVVLASITDGHLFSISMGGGNTFESNTADRGTNGDSAKQLASAEHGLDSFSFDPLMSRDIICCCSSESLVYIRSEQSLY